MVVFKQREWISVDSGLVESMRTIWFRIPGCNFMIRLSLHVVVILVKKSPSFCNGILKLVRISLINGRLRLKFIFTQNERFYIFMAVINRKNNHSKQDMSKSTNGHLAIVLRQTWKN